MIAPQITPFARSDAPTEVRRTTRDDRLTMALERYAAAIDAGHPLSKDELLKQFADVADELRGCLDSLDFIREIAPQLGDRHVGSDMRGSPDPAHPTSSPQPPIPSPHPATLGDFRILRELGRGGMGVVYEAEQLSLGRRVALKVLPFAAMLDRQQLARFKNEARAAATLDHPNIVAIYSVGVERGVHYYAMQLIEGQSLAQVVDQLRCGNPSPRPLTLGEGPGRGVGAGTPAIDSTETAPVAALSTLHAPSSQLPAFSSRDYYRTIAQLGIQAAEALDHAHQNGILHRDIKPANLLVECTHLAPRDEKCGHLAPRDESLKKFGHSSNPHLAERDAYTLKLWITDFGLARIEQDAGMTMTGDLLGTLRYMSPEQALAKRIIVDHRSDIYSLGVTLYELLTLQPAFTGDDRQELLRQIAFDEPRPPRQTNARIPQDLETIVLKAIEKNPADRYSTAHGLADDLRRFLDHEPIKAKPPTWRNRIAKWSRRHPAGLRATVLSTIVVAVAIAASIGWIARDQAARQTILNQQIEQALNESNTWYKSGNLSDALSAVRRAEGFLAGSGATVDLAQRTTHWHADLETIRQLDELRVNESGRAGVDSYAQVFNAYGIDFAAMPVGEAIAIINHSFIREELIAALYDWIQADWGNIGDAASWRPINVAQRKIFQFADQIDPDPWRRELRDAILQQDVRRLERLAKQPAALAQRPGTIHLLAGRLSRYHATAAATDFLEQTQRRYPNDFLINVYLMTCISQDKSRSEENIGYGRVIVALRPQSSLAHNYLGLALADAGQYEEAEAALREAIRLTPQRRRYRTHLVKVLHTQGKHEEAIAVLRDSPPPREIEEFIVLRDELMHSGNWIEAEAAARKVIELLPDLWSQRDALREILYAQQRYAEAVVEAREAIRLRPFPEITSKGYRVLGWACYRAGEWEASVEALEKSNDLLTDYPGGDSLRWFYLAMAHWQLGHEKEARDWYDRAVAWMEKHRPDDEELRSLRQEAAAVLKLPTPTDQPIGDDSHHTTDE